MQSFQQLLVPFFHEQLSQQLPVLLSHGPLFQQPRIRLFLAQSFLRLLVLPSRALPFPLLLSQRLPFRFLFDSFFSRFTLCLLPSQQFFKVE